MFIIFILPLVIMIFWICFKFFFAKRKKSIDEIIQNNEHRIAKITATNKEDEQDIRKNDGSYTKKNRRGTDIEVSASESLKDAISLGMDISNIVTEGHDEEIEKLKNEKKKKKEEVLNQYLKEIETQGATSSLVNKLSDEMEDVRNGRKANINDGFSATTTNNATDAIKASKKVSGGGRGM